MTPPSPKRFIRSLVYAWQGLQRAAASENSFRFHLLAAGLVILAMVIVRVRAIEAAILILIVALVLTMELVNTVVERFVGILEPRVHPYVRLIKDILAAAVLINSVAAVIIGVIIFWPYFWR